MAKLSIKKFKENYQKVIVIEKFDISPTPTRVTGVTRGDRTEGGEERREGGEEILADRPIKGSTRGPRGLKSFIDPFLLCFVKPSLIIMILITFVMETKDVILFVLDVDLWLCMCGGNQQPFLIGLVLIIFVLIIWTGGIC